MNTVRSFFFYSATSVATAIKTFDHIFGRKNLWNLSNLCFIWIFSYKWNCYLRFLRILKQESVISERGIGSSVMNRTRSRLTLAKRIISLNNNVQYGLTERLSTRERSPPSRMKVDIENIINVSNKINVYSAENKLFKNDICVHLPKIHCLPGIASTNGLHLVKTSRASKSCSVSNGLPSPNGSIMPSFVVISLYDVCNAEITAVKWLHSSEFDWQCDASRINNFSTSRKCCSGRWINVVKSGRFLGICGTVMKLTNSEFDWRDLFT